MSGIAKGVGDLALQLVNEVADNQNAETEKIPDTIESYNKMDYKTAMSFALDDAEDRCVKINVRGKLITLPPRSSNDSSAGELEKILNLNPRYRVHLNASSHFRFSILMTMLNLPICYDFVVIYNANPYEIAGLPLEFFQCQNWNSPISRLSTFIVLNLLADNETKMVIAAKNIEPCGSYHLFGGGICFDQFISKMVFFQKTSPFGDYLEMGS